MVGHLPAPLVMPVSHCSPFSTMPLPQTEEQSASVVLSAPGGQQPSIVVPDGIVMASQCAVQALPAYFLHIVPGQSAGDGQ